MIASWNPGMSWANGSASVLAQLTIGGKSYALESSLGLYGSLALPSLARPPQRSSNTSIVGDPSLND
jgi:hypothetical protein